MRKIRRVFSFIVCMVLIAGCLQIGNYSVRAASVPENVIIPAEDEDDPSVYSVYGDLNADGKISAADARIALVSSVTEDYITEYTQRFYAADVDFNEKINASDARMILRAAVKLEQLPAGKVHMHSWTDAVTAKEPTCTEQGLRTRTCILDRAHVLKEVIPETPHKLSLVKESETEGDKIYRAPFYRCSVCGMRFTDQTAKTVLQASPLVRNPEPITGTVKNQIESICKSFNATGVQVAVIKDGYVAQTYSYGIADKSTGRRVNEDTKYRAASLSKIATTCVFMALCDQGLVSESDDISKYFGYKCYNPYYPNITITPSMILTHSASFIGDSGRRLIPGALCNKAFYYNTKPGTTEQYSNFGFSVIACICERVTGKPLNELAKQYVFDPLGIDASFLAYKLKDTSNLGGLYGPEGNLTPAGMLSVREQPLGEGLTLAQGNLTISAKDYAKILTLLVNDGVSPEGRRVLSKRSTDSIKQVRIVTSHYGLGYATRRETTVFKGKVVYAHSGSAYGMFGGYVYCPDEKAGVVVFTSGCARSRVSSTQLYTICHQIIQVAYPNK